MKTFVFTDSDQTFMVEYLCSGLGDTDAHFSVSEIRGLDTLTEQGLMTFQKLVYSKKAFIDCANTNNLILLEVDGQAKTSTYLVGSMDIATLSGTIIAGGVTEAEIVTGGETIIITLSDNKWHADIAADNARTTALIAGIVGSDIAGTGWNDEVAITHTNVVRTSDTIVTITTPAAGSYAIAADETVTIIIPKEALAISKPGVFTCTNSIVITNA